MRKLFDLFLKSALIGLLPLTAGGQKTNSVVSIRSDTNAVYNFKVALNFPKKTFTNGEPVICMAGLTNISEVPTSVDPSCFLLDFNFLIANSHGVQVLPIHSVMHLISHGPETVQPHSVERCYIPYELSEDFRFSPGIYNVYAVRELGYPLNEVLCTSQVVTITILDSPVPSATNSPAQKPK
jgi:hypothetical protein